MTLCLRSLRTIAMLLLLPGAVLPGCERIVQNNVPLPAAETSCSVDADCVLVASGCPCSSGGKVVATNRQSADDVAARMDSVFCDAVISDDPGCFADAAVCHQGMCSLLMGDNP